MGTFFGLNSDYINMVYNQMFEMIKFGNWRFHEIHGLPIQLRNWFHKKLVEHYESQKDQ